MLGKGYFLNDYNKVAAFVVICDFLFRFKNKFYKKMENESIALLNAS